MKFRIILFILLFIFVSPHVDAKEFKDVPKTSSYYKDIQALTDLGIIKGYSDGTFKPGKYITNEQTATMLIRYLEAENMTFDDSFMKGFLDVTKKNSAYYNISASLYLNLMPFYHKTSFNLNGTIKASGLTFEPKKYTNRGNMASAIVKALAITGDETTKFKDQNEIAFTTEEISILANNGIVNGFTPTTYGPRKPITRAQFSKILNRAIQLQHKEKNIKPSLKLNEAIKPLKNYTENVRKIAYDNGRFAAITNDEYDLRFLDMHTLKTTTHYDDALNMAMYGDVVAYVEEYEATLIDLSTKTRKPLFFIHDEKDLQNISFSNDGRYIYVTTTWNSKNPHFIYDRQTGKLKRLAVTQVLDDVQWSNNIAYIKGTYNGQTGLMKYDPAQHKILGFIDYFESDYNNYRFIEDRLLYVTYTAAKLFDLTTGYSDQIVAFNNGESTSEREAVTTDGKDVYRLIGRNIQKINVDTQKIEIIYTAKNEKELKGADISIEGSYLFIYSYDTVFTMIKIK